MRDIVVACLLAAIVVVHGQETPGTPGSSSPFFNSWNGPSSPGPNNTQESVCVTDQASCGCCLMQRQMDSMEKFFNHSLNNLENNLKMVEHALTKVRTSRSAFSVALTNKPWFCLEAPVMDAVIDVVYEHVFLNLGDNYNPADGVFTVPRSGVYSLALTVYSDAGAPGNSLHACASLAVNGEVKVRSREMNQQDQEDSTTTVLAMQLNAGDKVCVKLPVNCKLCDNNSHFNTFSGFLLYSTD